MPKSHKEKVLVAMSGGVDSSVAAALLVQKGYNVTGVFMVNYNHENDSSLQGVVPPSGTKPCWLPDYYDALRVAAKLGIPLLRWDFEKEYRQDVLGYMFKEYEAGRTPNPDVLCNKYIKFGRALKEAKKMGFDYLATGHYAKTRRLKDYKIKLMEAKDKNKDQTYFLHQLTQEQLKHVMFPIGNYTKPEVRKLAKKFDLPTATKEESMGICFIGEVPMDQFLKQRIKEKPGNIIMNGKIVGRHQGLAFYTIGQRVGVKFPISNLQFPINSQSTNSKPIFVADKDIKTNTLVVVYEGDPLLYKKEAAVSKINWISGHLPKFPLKCQVRLRHRQPLQNCAVDNLLSKVQSPKSIVRFANPQRAITPGQFAVFYKNGECLGGGVVSA